MGWYIDKILWSGAVITVGEDKDYANIQDAFDAVTEDTLILVDTGDYTGADLSYFTNPNKIYVRGLGNSCLDTILDTLASGVPTRGEIVFENIWLKGGIQGFKGIISKCQLLSQDGPYGRYPVSGLRGATEIRFTKIIPYDWIPYVGYGPHLTGINGGDGFEDLSGLSLYRVSYTLNGHGSWYERNCSGTLALDVKEIDGTYGYGYEYGDYKIVEVTTNDRYWVGGTGIWESTTNWSYSSGGSGGYSIPTSADSVYFDANSFTDGGQTVTVSAGVCNSMTWNAVPYLPSLLFGESGYITTYGDITLYHAMYLEYTAPDLNAFAHSSFMLEYTPVVSRFKIGGDCHLATDTLPVPPIEVLENGTLYLTEDTTFTTLWVRGDFDAQGYNITAQGIKFEPADT